MPIGVECPECEQEVGGIPRGKRKSVWPSTVPQLLRCSNCDSNLRFEHRDDLEGNQPVLYFSKPDSKGEEEFLPGDYRWKTMGDASFHY